MVGKIHAAVDARDQALIIARTDAIAVEGFEPALERGERYLEAGADVLFIEAPQTAEQLTEVATRFGARVPLLANMVEGGRTPLASAPVLGEMGYRIVIFPGGTVRALAYALRTYFASLHSAGTTEPFRDRMLDFDSLNALIGTPEILRRGQAYDATNILPPNTLKD